MDEDWKAAYEAGIFTEFMSSGRPHTVLDDKIYKKGMADFQADIRKAIAALDFHSDPEAFRKKEELEAMSVAAGALIRYAARHAEKARELAALEKDPLRKAELEKIAAVCARVPRARPRLLGGPPILLVRPPGGHHRAQHLGLLQPGPARPASFSVLQKGLEEGTLPKRRPGSFSRRSGSSSTTSRRLPRSG